MSPRDQTWHHYASVMEKFRKLCNPDSGLFKQAENRIRAKRVVEAWESQGRPFADAVNPFRLSQKMDELVLDLEDERQVDDLYRAKLAFRDRLCAALGKGDTEGWDVFHDRHSTSAKIPNVVKQFELAGKHVPLAKPAITTHGLAPEGRK
jgi:hypothetical protein